MKIALIGTGKTGGVFGEIAGGRHEILPFSRRNPPTAEALAAADAVMVFVPAEGLSAIMPALQGAGRPVVCGTTGFSFADMPSPAEPWIVASNFSIGMNAAFFLARLLGRLGAIAPASYAVHEVHHVHKKDAPSGTALYLQGLLPAQTPVTADRVGEVAGLHRLSVALAGETIRLEHEALDRSVFAQGALFALENLLPGLEPGMHRFEQLMETKIRKELYA
jgi:4-hydroxy-tetrahydrodipicolinate reductase